MTRMTELAMHENLEEIRGDPDMDSGMMGRLKGRYMQAMMDLYRVQWYSTARNEEILEQEIRELRELMDFQRQQETGS